MFLCLKYNPWYHTDLSQPRVVILSVVEGFVSVVIQGDVTRPLFAFIEDLNIRLLPVDPPVNGSVCAGVHVQEIALVTECYLPVTQFIFQNEEIRQALIVMSAGGVQRICVMITVAEGAGIVSR